MTELCGNWNGSAYGGNWIDEAQVTLGLPQILRCFSGFGAARRRRWAEAAEVKNEAQITNKTVRGNIFRIQIDFICLQILLRSKCWGVVKIKRSCQKPDR